MDDAGVTEDSLLGGTVRLLQPRRGHRAGTDAVLLARLCGARAGDCVVDLGAASGAVGLMVARTTPGTKVRFVERDPALVALCRRNIVLNGFGDRAAAIEADVFAELPDLGVGPADLVVTNPPFFAATQRSSPEPGRRAAHQMRGGTLADWLAAAARLLKPRGRLALIHRADHLDACLAALNRHFGSWLLRAVHPREHEPASRILVTVVRGGRSRPMIAPALVLHDEAGRFSAEAARLHAAIDEAPIADPQL